MNPSEHPKPCANPPRLCFVNLDAYPALAVGLESHRIGGEEVQHSLLATLFARAGYDVSLVTGDFGQRDGERIAGVRVHPSFKARAGLPVLRFIHPRWTLLHAALRRADADVHYVSCAGALVGWVAWFAQVHGRRVVFRVASDTDCDPSSLLISTARDRWLYHYGLRRAHSVLAQTTHQQGLLRQNYGIDAVLAPMALDVPERAPDHTGRDIDVLWVANLRALKRPELLVEAARRLPHLRFHLVGGLMDAEPEVHQSVTALANTVPNLQLHGRVGFHETLALFNRARLFVSTSLIEGFPNTFLQAWARETPSVSYFDPDGLVTRHGLGQQVTSTDELVGAIDSFLRHPVKLHAAAQSCGQFMRERYAHEQVLAPYRNTFAQVMASSSESIR